MSTRVSKPEQAPQAETRPAKNQFEQYVEQQLESTRQQVKLTELTSGLLTLGLWLLGLLIAGILLDSWVVQFGPVARLIAFAILIGGGLWIAWSKIAVLFLRRIHRLYAARMIESGSENFHNSLVNYLQVKEGGQVDREAIVQAISQRAARDLSQISPTEKVDRSRAIQLGFGLVGLVGALVAYTLLSPKSPWPSIARILNPVSNISAPTIVQVTKVSPGDTEVFFGQKLLVTAEIRGRHSPDEVRLVYTTEDGQFVDVPAQMLPTGSGGSYQLELSTTPSGIDGPLSYFVTANDGRSPTFSVDVKPNPAITLEQIEIIPPAYSRLPPRTLTGQTEIDGLEGSKVKLTAVANMPIQVAWVELLRQRTRGRETSYEVVRTVELRSDDALKASGEFTLSLDANRTSQIYSHYQLLFRTADGQRNPLVNIQPLRITPDLPPVVKVVRPFDREVAVPLNRSLELELQAEDPDFEISRLQLLLDHQGGLLLDEEIELGENRKQQRLSATYRFEPRKLRLSVGDEVLFHGKASDNRVAALSGQPDPNISRTENYKIKITEPLETEIVESNQPNGGTGQANSGQVADNQQGNPPTANQPSEPSAEKTGNQQATNQAGNDQQKTGEPAASEGAQAEMNQSQPGESPGEQSAQNQDPAANKQPTSDQPQPSQESNPKGADQATGNQAEQNKQPSASEQQNPGQNSGDETGQKEAGQKSSGSGKQESQSGNADSGQPESGKQGEQPGETQANPQAAEKQTGENPAGQKSDPQQPEGGTNPSGKSAAEKSNPAGNQNDPSNSQQPSGSGQPESMPQSPQSKPQPPQQNNPGAQSQKNQAQGNQAQGNQAAGEQSAGNPSSGDQSSEQSGNQSSSNSTNKSGSSANSNDSGAGAADSAADKNESPASQPGSEPSASEPSASEPSAGDPSANEPLDKSATDAERFRRLQERLERQRNEADQQSAERQPNEAGNTQPQNQAGEKTPPEPSNSKQSAGDQTKQPEANGKQTDAGSDNPPRPAEAQSNSGEQRPGQSANKPSPANQPKQPQAQQPPGGGSGDQQGEKQGEQGGQQAGGGQAGDQQAGDQSSKSSSDSKSGSSIGQSGNPSGGQSGKEGEPSENSNSGANGGQDSKSGKSGSQSGQGSSASGQPSGQPSTSSGSSGNASGADNAQGTDSEISQRKDQPQDQRSAAGQANTASAGVGSNESPTAKNDDQAGTAEGNLEYSEKATDLVLDHLRNQSNNPDPELLREMNWTEQDLKDFLTRWEAMKQKANSGTPQERKRYADALRSLGLRPEEVRRNVLQSRRDQLNKLSEDGAVNRPPANLAEPFNAFLKNRNRVQKDKDK